MVVDHQGRPRTTLEYGQYKALHGDRIVLVPGPEAEQRAVRWLFEQVARHRTRPEELARSLNEQGFRHPNGKPWRRDRVEHMLSNEKYIGRVVYNRTSFKLKTRLTLNPLSQREDVRHFPHAVPVKVRRTWLRLWLRHRWSGHKTGRTGRGS